MDQREQLRRIREITGTPSLEIAAALDIPRTKLSFFWNQRGDLTPLELQKVSDYLFARLTEKYQQLTELKEALSA